MKPLTTVLPLVPAPWESVAPTALIGIEARGVNGDLRLNLGDDVQTEAAARLYGDLPVLDRCKPNTWGSGEAVVMCHWFGDPFWESCDNVPTRATVFLLGTHFSPLVRRHMSKLKDWLAGAVREQGFPAFCRDIYTRNCLRSMGVDAEFGGCVTQTLRSTGADKSAGGLCVDADPLPGYTVMTNATSTYGSGFYDRRDNVLNYLAKLDRSRHVLTSRLHALLPCRAFGTPVTLQHKDWSEECGKRFSGHVCPHDDENPPRPEDCRIQLCNGMVDRIGQLFSFNLKASVRERSPVVVSSVPDVACNGNLLELFEPVDGVVEVRDMIRGECLRDKRESIYYDRRAAMYQAADELRLTAELSQKVRDFAASLGTSFTAVHVRRTDKMYCWSRPKMRDLTSFYAALDADGDSIFLATDCGDVQRRFRDRYGDRLVVAAHIDNRPGQLRATTLSAALFDLAMCTVAPKFEGDPCSGWFDLVNAFRDTGQSLVGPRKLASRGRCALSFSLYGSDDLYRKGMLANLKIAKDLYQGWDVVVHTDSPDAAAAVAAAGATTVMHPKSADQLGMFWRYETREPYDVVCFRDADSRVGVRDRELVELWLHGVRGAHVMRDHAAHKRPIQGGMWGVRTASFDVGALLDGCKRGHYGDDETALATRVWPALRHDCLVHDNTERRPEGAHAFPKLAPARSDNPFIGAKIRV